MTPRTDPAAAPAAPRAGGLNRGTDHDDPRRWWTLGALCLSLSIVMVGNGSVNVALPSIARELDASDSALQWIVDSYALIFAGMLFAAGTIGDRFGRKGALQGGLVLFLAAAGAAMLADTPGEVIAVRATMGLAAAFVMPSTLSILSTVFSPAERPRAIALWAGIAAGGAALGPPASGLLLQHFWWGSVFLVNVPLVVGALVAGWWLVPTSRDPDSTRLDVPGALLSIIAIGSFVYAIIEAPHLGWLSTGTGAAFGVAAVVFAGFVAWERRTPAPMLDLRLFRDPRFSVASAGISLAFFTMFGTFFLLTQLLQLVHGLSPLGAGLMILPMSLTLMTVAPQAPKLVQRFGVRAVVPAGMTVTAAGLTLLGTVGATGDAWQVHLGVIPMAAGMAVTMTPLTSLIMAAVPPSRAGVGSAMNDTTRELGGALGVAVLGSLVTTVYTADLEPSLRGLPAGATDQASTGLAGALQVADGLSTEAGAALSAVARDAFVRGLGFSSIAGAVLLAGGGLAARRLLPRERTEAPEGPSDPAVTPAALPDGTPAVVSTAATPTG